MDCEKIYITDEFYWRKEDFDKNIASRTKIRPVVYCVHGHVVSDVKCPRECRGCRDEFKKMVNVVAEKLWCDEKKNIFIEMANNVHNNKYTYPDFKYDGNKTPGNITCPLHGNFPQRPNNHLRGAGCPICGSQASADANRKALETFIIQANEVHDNKYTYPDFKYVDSKTPGDITCPVHGNFPQRPNNHLWQKHGCRLCTDKTEGIVFAFLKDVLEPLGFKVEHMGKRDSKGVGKMDIRITKGDMTIYVEVDGKQHFDDVEKWKSKAEDVRKRDLKKHLRAAAKGHAVIRIDQVWVWNSHAGRVTKNKRTEWSSRLRQTIVKLVSGVEPSIDELFLSNRPDKYFNHPCYQQMKRSS